MRRVIFAKPVDMSDAVVSAQEMGESPFALLVEYIRPTSGFLGLKRTYGLKARIKMRDGVTGEALLQRHPEILDFEIYVDREREVAVDRHKELHEELRENMNPTFVWTPQFYGIVGKLAWNKWEHERSVRVDFKTLLKGIEVKGEKMERLSWLARELTNAVDRLAAKIATGQSFDRNERRVYASGKPKKVEKAKPNVPPGKWRR